MRRSAAVIPILLVAFGSRAFAEVMDKEPTITQNWLYAGIGGLIAIAAWRWRWWAGLAFSALWFLGLWNVRQELTDPWVGPAILTEAGQRYATHFYLSALLALLLQGAAFYAAWRTHRVRRTTGKDEH